MGAGTGSVPVALDSEINLGGQFLLKNSIARLKFRYVKFLTVLGDIPTSLRINLIAF